MSVKELCLPFPLGGYDANWAYSAQPPKTTPGCLNVRGYSTDQERARGGSRPGLRRAYDQQVGGAAVPVQWLGWLDWGFGDVVSYDDEFAYADGALSGQANWTAADGNLLVKDGYVHPGGGSLPYADVSSGEFQSFGGDTWDDFTLEAALRWNYGTTGDVTFWVSSSSGDATGGARVKLAYTSTWIDWPGLGFSSTLTITLESGSSSRTYSKSMGVFATDTAGALRVAADSQHVRVFWNGQEVASVGRDAGTCSKAGFKMSMSKPSGSPLTDSMTNFRLLSWHLTAITQPTTVGRKLVAVAGRDLWAESSEGTLASVAADALSATPALYSAAHCNGNLFILDGATAKWFNPMASGGAGEVANWTARRGKVESTCRIVVNWRNRLVLAGSTYDPQNFFMSRQDDPWDFDYSCGDSKSAVTGSLSESGRIGDPIAAMCPLSDDVLVIGSTRSVWVLQGDPMAGGRVIRRSDRTGILGQNAWTTDPAGNLYFLGEEGLYVMSPLGQPKNLTRTRIPGLAGCKPVRTGYAGAAGETYATLAYDADRHGVLILLTPYAGGAATHYFYDLRNDAFWPESYPDDIGPTCAAYYSATSPAYRKVLLGGRNGYLYQFDDAAKNDNVSGQDVAVSSYVWIGPRRLGGGVHDAIVTRVVGVLSSGSDTTGFGIHAADTPEAVLSAAAAASGDWSAGMNVDRSRVRGGAHALKLHNSTASRRWAVESITLEFVPGGVQR